MDDLLDLVRWYAHAHTFLLQLYASLSDSDWNPASCSPNIFPKHNTTVKSIAMC